MLKNFPIRLQPTEWACGPTVAQMVLFYFGKRIGLKELIQEMQANPAHGTSRRNLIETLRRHGLFVHTHSQSTLAEIRAWLKQGAPVVVNFRHKEDNEGHYAVVTNIRDHTVYLADPWPYVGKDFPIPDKLFLERMYGRARRKDHSHWIAAVSNQPFSQSLQKKNHCPQRAKEK
jgi:ABC-type bacteriocin/lantibiotic exporter with double-glycine peptidase domain